MKAIKIDKKLEEIVIGNKFKQGTFPGYQSKSIMEFGHEYRFYDLMLD